MRLSSRPVAFALSVFSVTRQMHLCVSVCIWVGLCCERFSWDMYTFQYAYVCWRACEHSYCSSIPLWPCLMCLSWIPFLLLRSERFVALLLPQPPWFDWTRRFWNLSELGLMGMVCPDGFESHVNRYEMDGQPRLLPQYSIWHDKCHSYPRSRVRTRGRLLQIVPGMSPSKMRPMTRFWTIGKT